MIKAKRKNNKNPNKLESDAAREQTGFFDPDQTTLTARHRGAEQYLNQIMYSLGCPSWDHYSLSMLRIGARKVGEN